MIVSLPPMTPMTKPPAEHDADNFTFQELILEICKMNLIIKIREIGSKTWELERKTMNMNENAI